MPAVWFALKRSLDCKSEVSSDVHDPAVNGSSLTKISTRKTSKSGCSRSISNLKDVIHGSNRHMERPQRACSPRSIGSNELLNPITHEVVLNNSTCELKISSGSSSNIDNNNNNGGSTFMGTLKPGTPLYGYPRSSGSGSGSGSGIHMRKKLNRPSFGVIPSKPNMTSFGRKFDACSSLTCHKCGEQFAKWEAVESHHLSKHAVTELVEGDSSRKIVELIYRTSWSKSNNNNCRKIERILKVHNMQKTLAQFEEHREKVKIKASKLAKKHPRCLADGNELLRFYGTSVECKLGINGSSSLCTSDRCSVCRIIKNGFINGRVGVFTTSTSERAFESVQMFDDYETSRRALIVCRVIAGRVHKPLDNIEELAAQSGFDSLDGKVGVHSNIEELYLLNPRALLPCFVIICKP